MGPEGCRHVSEMLHQNINLKKLDLSYNNFGDSVGAYLCDAFKVAFFHFENKFNTNMVKGETSLKLANGA